MRRREVEKMLAGAASAAELKEKRGRVQAWLRAQELDAVLIGRHENLAWLTAGQVDVRVGLLRETGPASVVVTRDDRAFYVTTNNEAARLAEEEFGGLEYEAVIQPWYAADVVGAVKKIVGEGRVGSDAGVGEFAMVNLQPLRMLLTDGEVGRYRWLGGAVAEVVGEVVEAVRPGMTEREMQARLAAELIRRGILPSVYLEAADARVRSYRHAVPRDGVVEKLAMVGVCARRWGLTACMTRFVHFGAMPGELEEKFAGVRSVNDALRAATREGVSAAELFEVARVAYAEAGFAGEETMHHQGGATGYMEREWVARPGGAERLTAVQAVAWNPNIEGAKVEDTVLLQGGVVESLTGAGGVLVR